ncbi:hypothetical protein SMJ63A_10458 [Stenotrophomonas geniculata]
MLRAQLLPRGTLLSRLRLDGS